MKARLKISVVDTVPIDTDWYNDIEPVGPKTLEQCLAIVQADGPDSGLFETIGENESAEFKIELVK
jgi:hypothetical protein